MIGKRDSKDTNLHLSKLMAYIQTVGLLNIIFFSMIMLDDYQKSLAIMYWFLILDGVIFFTLFKIDDEKYFNIFMSALCLNFVVVFIWGIVVYCTDKDLGVPFDPWDKKSTATPSAYFISYWYTIFYFWN